MVDQETIIEAIQVFYRKPYKNDTGVIFVEREDIPHAAKIYETIILNWLRQYQHTEKGKRTTAENTTATDSINFWSRAVLRFAEDLDKTTNSSESDGAKNNIATKT